MQTTSVANSLQPVVTTHVPVNKMVMKPKRNEQSLDYVVKSGLAGGVAGCVVSLIRPHIAG